ncbi:MAG: cation transporter [Clostridiales bacterium]|nr:cation transporter [Clostridiales bacterium]
MSESNKRTQKGAAVSVAGLIMNIFLAASKIAAGFIFGAVSVIADGVNNASDSLSSLVSLVFFKLSSKPADKEHPFGHERYEYIATIVIAFIIFAVGVSLIRSSIEKIISKSAPLSSDIVLWVLATGIAVKIVMGSLYFCCAKKISSTALKAAGVDAFTDVLATTAVLIAAIVLKFTGVNLDGYFGILVAIFVIASGIKVIKAGIDPLIGCKPDPELEKKVEDKILSHDGVLGLHKLMIHSYGQNKHFASVDVEVDEDMDMQASHDLADHIEDDLKKMGVVTVVHIDPRKTKKDELQKD